MNGAKAELKNFIDHYFKILGSWDILHATIPIATKLMPYSPLSTLSNTYKIQAKLAVPYYTGLFLKLVLFLMDIFLDQHYYL